MIDKAYDYKAQRWVEGPEATELLRAQMMDEIELLAGDEGDNFAMMIGVNRKDQLEKTIRCLRESLAERLPACYECEQSAYPCDEHKPNVYALPSFEDDDEEPFCDCGAMSPGCELHGKVSE